MARPRPKSAAPSPAPQPAPPPQQPRVLVMQLDTRPPPSEDLAPRLRTWPGGIDHADMRARYTSANPPPGKREYRTLTAIANAWHARALGWAYRSRQVAPPPGRHPSWVKIRHVLDAWDQLAAAWDAVLVLDTDAWIRDAEGLDHAVRTTLLADPDAAYLAAGEPTNREVSDHRADVMNGGFMCFKPDPRVRDFLDAVWDLADDPSAAAYARDWPWEQACLCRAWAADAAGCKAWMRVLPPTQCNTPAGALVAHCWYKDLAHDLCLEDLLSDMGRQLLGLAKPSIEFVVARYGEDVSWMDAWLPYVQRVTVYDKSDVPMTSAHPKVTVVPLKNVGREAHAYLRHIVDRYEDLCATVVFTQARYDDHLSHQDFDALVRGRGRPDSPMDVPWHQTIMETMGWTVTRNWAANQAMQPMGMSMAKFFIEYIAPDLVPPDKLRYWTGAIFSATASAIRRHPAAAYAKILPLLEVGSNPEAAHAMERSWQPLLGHA